jgi:ribosome-binding factor A
MAGERMRRVNGAIRQVLADALAGELADPRLGFVTVTDVNTSPDLRQARVFVSVLGDEDVREGTLAALASAHGVLQARIASQLSLKRTPRLEFLYDPTTDRALRVESLIREQQ